jgi:hypothetical protein
MINPDSAAQRRDVKARHGSAGLEWNEMRESRRDDTVLTAG